MSQQCLLCATCIALLVACTAYAQQILSPAEMRTAAAQSVLKGRSDVALDLTGALITRDSLDIDAHLIRSRAARNLGAYDVALDHARVAWRLADVDRARYASALAMAQALSSSGRRTAAQLWLRRAVQIAPNEAQKAQAARDFTYVRRHNPWATALQFSVSPSSNFNNGSRNETSQLFDLPFEFQLEGEARALSGVEVSAGVSTRYRLVANGRKRTDLQFGASHKTYALSDDAKDIAPDAEGSDFATTSAFFGIQETYRLPDPRTQLGWNLRLGATRYGGEDLLRYARLGTNVQHVLESGGLISASLSHEQQDGLNGRDDASIWSARFGYGMALDNGNRLSVSTSLTQSESDSDFLDYTQRNFAVRYSLAKPVGPAMLDFGLVIGDKHHDRSGLSADGREARSVEASVTAALPELDYYGFIPTVTLRAERTNANIDIYETESFGIQMGIRSAF